MEAPQKAIGHLFRLCQQVFADISFRFIHNSQQRGITVTIFRQEQIGRQIPCNPMVIQMKSPIPQMVGNPTTEQCSGKSTPLNIGTENHGNFFYGHSFFQ